MSITDNVAVSPPRSRGQWFGSGESHGRSMAPPGCDSPFAHPDSADSHARGSTFVKPNSGTIYLYQSFKDARPGVADLIASEPRASPPSYRVGGGSLYHSRICCWQGTTRRNDQQSRQEPRSLPPLIVRSP